MSGSERVPDRNASPRAWQFRLATLLKLVTYLAIVCATTRTDGLKGLAVAVLSTFSALVCTVLALRLVGPRVTAAAAVGGGAIGGALVLSNPHEIPEHVVTGALVGGALWLLFVAGRLSTICHGRTISRKSMFAVALTALVAGPMFALGIFIIAVTAGYSDQGAESLFESLMALGVAGGVIVAAPYLLNLFRYKK